MFNSRKLILASLLSCGLLVICLAWLLIGSEIKQLDKQVDTGAGIVAGPLSDGVTIEQAITIPEISADDALHLGFQFATYSKTNLGQILIQVEQGSVQKEQTVQSSRLADNDIAYFPFSGLKPGKARLTIQGLNGPSHNSATVWCHLSSELPPMVLNGELSDKSVDVWFVHKSNNTEEVFYRVGVGGLVFLSVVFFAVLTTLFYRGFVEMESISGAKSFIESVLRSVDVGRLLISVPASLLAGGLVALILFLTSDRPYNFLPLNDEFSEERVPIAPLSKGVVVEQSFEVTSEMAGSEIGLGLSFGTFLRTNKAKVELKVSQGDKSDRVILNSKSLVDGAKKIFVFAPLDVGDASLTISGINGKGSNSPTVWFEPSQIEPLAQVNGETVPQRLLLFRYIAVPDERSYVIGGSVFPLHWLVGVVLTVFVLIQMRGRGKKPA